MAADRLALLEFGVAVKVSWGPIGAVSPLH